ncbi:hypothetical protein LO762_14615 [Actinocorallia sp. API 0066]|uniref:hypothetical protein n=1 Tax=Actinocorallia sp. API 0066 TaxID=2896846 RepID=UPI001E5E8DBB|nr:hypothetical protein [Actinocorallia sp. API 0066]MCD0450414.1 hypothetical protein [Actinocorallia sp. API 0066]
MAKVLGSTLSATPEVESSQMATVRELWSTSQAIAATCFVLLVTLAGAALMAGQAMPGGITPRELAAGVVWAFISANISLSLIGYLVTFANGLSRAFLTGASQAIDPARVARVIVDRILLSVATRGVFIALVALVAVVLAVCVGFTYVMRLALTMCVIAVAPITLMFHALPMTSGIARLWWRALAGLLAVQVCQSFVLATAFRVLVASDGDDTHPPFFPDDDSALLELLLIICLLFILVRIPGLGGAPRLAGRATASAPHQHDQELRALPRHGQAPQPRLRRQDAETTEFTGAEAAAEKPDAACRAASAAGRPTAVGRNAAAQADAAARCRTTEPALWPGAAS